MERDAWPTASTRVPLTMAHTQTICQGKQDQHAKSKASAFYLIMQEHERSPLLCAQHLECVSQIQLAVCGPRSPILVYRPSHLPAFVQFCTGPVVLWMNPLLLKDLQAGSDEHMPAGFTTC